MSNDQHDRIDRLLPWFVSGSLSDEESAEVRRHAGNCVACRGQLRELEELQSVVRDAPTPSVEVSPGLIASRAAAITEPEATQPTIATRAPSRPLRWVLVSQAAALALVAALLVLRHSPEEARPSETPQFRTLASEPVAQTTDGPRLRVLFAESITEQHLRQLLHRVGGRIVDGPNVAGLYVVALGPATGEGSTLADRLLMLRADDGVRFVELEAAAP